MSFSAGSQQMIDFWKDYEKPSPAEARRRKRERELNAERLPWVLHFTVARQCEGKYSKSNPCKISAFWAYTIPEGYDSFHQVGECFIVCIHHMLQINAEDYNDTVNKWFKANGWIKVNEDGTTTEVPYQ